jgi:hypothetical protein
VKLKADFVGGKAHAVEPRPLERVLAFLDVLLGRAPVVVESQCSTRTMTAYGTKREFSSEHF